MVSPSSPQALAQGDGGAGGQLALANGYANDEPSWKVVPARPGPGETTYECRVPNNMVGLVIGKGGEAGRETKGRDVGQLLSRSFSSRFGWVFDERSSLGATSNVNVFLLERARAERPP